MNVDTTKDRRLPRVAALLTTALMTLIAAQAAAAPGDLLRDIVTPVNPGTAIGIAADCEDPTTLFYTTSFGATLHKMDDLGAVIGAPIPITDSATGAPVSIGAIQWDQGRGVLWGGTDSAGSPVSIYIINPATGVATYQFTTTTGGFGFTDGIGYDGGTDTVYVSDDVSTVIDEHNATSPHALVRTLTPVDAGGTPLGSISGVIVGKGDLLYLGRSGLDVVDQVKKSDGTFIAGGFATTRFRVEDLECDLNSFAPLEVIWVKDAFNGHVAAFEVEPGTCQCGGGAILTCTLGFWKNHPEDWASLDPDDEPAWGGGLTYMEIFNTAPKKGDASVMLAHAYIAAVLNTGADAGDLADALVLLTAHPVGSGDLTAGKNAHPDRAVALAVAESLQGFNESTECPL
jgi:hypothetical protein